MKLHNIDADVGERKIKRNVAEGQSEKEKKGRLKKFCSKLWDSTKGATQVLAVAVGITVMAYSCGGKTNNNGDGDVSEVIDTENDCDALDILDILDIEVEDVPEEETNCLPPGEILEGEVDPLLANTEEGVAELNGSDSEVSGDYELIIGGEVSGDLLILGECPDDPDSIAAFGAQDGTVEIMPEYRLDFGQTVFIAELPGVDGDVCSSPEVDEDIVSMYNDEANLAVKKTTVGTVNTRGEFGFTTTFEPSIFVNGLEADSSIPLDGYGYDVKAIMLSIENPLLEMGAKVYSNTGEEVLSREVEGSVDSISSKKLRVYQLGSGDYVMPPASWEVPGYLGIKACLRSEGGEPKEETVKITADITPLVSDSCSSNISVATDVILNTVGFHEIAPPHMIANYSVVSYFGEGLGTLENGNPSISITLRREAVIADFGENTRMEISVEGNIITMDANPKTGLQETSHFSFIMYVYDPDANFEYESECGYRPGGIE